MSENHHAQAGFHGPKCWILTLFAGLIVGAVLAYTLPRPAAFSSEEIAQLKGKEQAKLEAEIEKRIEEHKAKGEHAHESAPVPLSQYSPPNIPLYFAIPFAILLLSIALMPFINVHFWGRHFGDFAFFLGGIVVAVYLLVLNGFTDMNGVPGYGLHKMGHVAMEYFQFIALVGSLYVVTGGILVDIRGRGMPILNTAILFFGAVIANVIGTTGASALLIRSYIRINKARIRSFHVVLFIFIVANCGGCLTPIGDPPLFLGYLQGIPFTWTLKHCLPAWAVCLSCLLSIFFVLDWLAYRKHIKDTGEETNKDKTKIVIKGNVNFLCLGLILVGVFLDQILAALLHIHAPGVGACFQVVVATVAYKTANREILKANEFSFAPIEEVGLLFVGLFATMVPALDYLGNNASSLGIDTPSKFYWASGALSSFLDNAPTYLNFLSAGHGLAGLEMGNAPEKTLAFLKLAEVGKSGSSAFEILLAISLGSVFFGSMTYIGNAPNFMVKAIAESAGVRMPSFFGYIFKYSVPILLMVVFPLVWLIFLRA